jgi:hypothetical protein
MTQVSLGVVTRKRPDPAQQHTPARLEMARGSAPLLAGMAALMLGEGLILRAESLSAEGGAP